MVEDTWMKYKQKNISKKRGPSGITHSQEKRQIKNGTPIPSKSRALIAPDSVTMWDPGDSCRLGRMQNDQRPRKADWHFLASYTCFPPIWSSNIFFFGSYLKQLKNKTKQSKTKWKQHLTQMCTWIFFYWYFTYNLSKVGTSQDVYQWGHGQADYGTVTQWNITQSWKEMYCQTTHGQAGPQVLSMSRAPSERAMKLQRFREGSKKPKHIVQDGTVAATEPGESALQEHMGALCTFRVCSNTIAFSGKLWRQ